MRKLVALLLLGVLDPVEAAREIVLGAVEVRAIDEN
jgi:hypothetical protein